MRGRRYDFHDQGQKATFVFVVLLAVSSILYFAAHLRHPPSADAARVKDLVRLNTDGIVEIRSPDDINWYVGDDKAKPILQGIGVRNEQIDGLKNEMRDLARRAQTTLSAGNAAAIRRLLAEIEAGEPWHESKADTDQECACSPCDHSIAELARAQNCEHCSHCLRAGNPLETAYANSQPTGRLVEDLLNRVNGLASRVDALRLQQGAGVDALVELQSIVTDIRRRLQHSSGDKTRLDSLMNSLEALLTENAPPSPDGKPLSAGAHRAGAQAQTLEELAGETAAIRSWLERQEDPAIRMERLLGRIGTTHEALSDLRIKFAIWTRLRGEQQAAVASLTPPVRMTFFWVSPQKLTLEILAWSLFGVLTNLLLHTAEATRNGTFRRSELIVGLTKLLYGPVVSLMLCIAIITQFVPYDARVWTMPVIAFLFGYNARKSANLVDWLSSKLLDRFRTAAERGPAEVAEERAKRQADYLGLVQARSVSQLRTIATRLANEAAYNAVRANEARVNPAK